MTWHEQLTLEIELEFVALCAPYFECVIETIWRKQQYALRRWGEHGKWWNKTTAGHRCNRDRKRKKAASLKTILVETRICKGCGRKFAVNAYQIKNARGRALICSPQCRGKCRANIRFVTIDGESKTLPEWARCHGIAIETVRDRIKRGWDIHRALGIPGGPPV